MPLDPKSLQRKFVIVQENQPSSPFDGQIWVDTSTQERPTLQYNSNIGEFEEIAGGEGDGKTIIENQDGNLEAQALHTFNEVNSYTKIIANALEDGDEILNLNVAENEKLIIHEISMSGGAEESSFGGYNATNLDMKVGEESRLFEPSVYGTERDNFNISSLNLPTPLICEDDTVISADAGTVDRENMSSVIFYEVISE